MKETKTLNVSGGRATRIYLLGGFRFIQEDWMKKKKARK